MRKIIAIVAAVFAIATPALAADINLVIEMGTFDHYLSVVNSQDYLVIDVEGRLVYVQCAAGHATGCDEFNADETVRITGHLGDPVFVTCDDPVQFFNAVVPDKAERCGDGVVRVCVDLAD